MVSVRKLLLTLLSLILLAVVCLACTNNAPSPTVVVIPLSAQTQTTPLPTQSSPTSAAAATATTAAPAPAVPPDVVAAPAAPEATQPVPAPIMALGNRLSLTLRAQPDAAAPVVAVVSGSDVLWAEGRSEDGLWMLVTFGGEEEGEDEMQAWAATADLTLMGQAEELDVVTGEQIASAPQPADNANADDEQSSDASLTGSVLPRRLNVRAGPGLDQPRQGQLSYGDNVTVRGRSEQGEWLAIAWANGTAWIAARYVDLAGAADGLPILAVASTKAFLPAPVLAGKIVFQTRSGGDIYVMNGDGNGLRRLTDGLDPALSPDGNMVAYARWGAPQGVFVLDLGSGQEQRVASTNRPRSPTWSSDGNRLAFSHLSGSSTCRETPFGCLSDGAVRQWLGGQECGDTMMGRYCVNDFPLRHVEETALAQVTLADGSWLDLAASPGVQSPYYHPLWDEILYRTKEGLQITAPDGQTRSLVTDPSMSSPAWSPDGQHIVVQMFLHDHSDIFLLNAAGQTVRRLTASPSNQKAANNVAPAWSSDGRYITFMSDRAGEGQWRLYRMAADGSQQILLLPAVLGEITLTYNFAAERVASWSP